jgi:hypothetical protein
MADGAGFTRIPRAPVATTPYCRSLTIQVNGTPVTPEGNGRSITIAPCFRSLLERGAHAGVAQLAAALGHLQRLGRGEYDIAAASFDWGVPVDGGIRSARTEDGLTPLEIARLNK